MKSSFLFYLLGIADVVILFYNLGQTFKWLTCTETNTPYILVWREYLFEHGGALTFQEILSCFTYIILREIKKYLCSCFSLKFV